MQGMFNVFSREHLELKAILTHWTSSDDEQHVVLKYILLFIPLN